MPPADYTTKNKEPPLDLMNKPPQNDGSGSKESGPGNSQPPASQPQQPPPPQQQQPPTNSPAGKLMQHYQHYPYKFVFFLKMYPQFKLIS
jgi:hypothetical protein